MSLSSQILLSLVLGLATGLFFGELASPVKPIGDAFILLLQMTVIPYVSISLITGLGSLRAEGAARLAWRAGSILIVLWGLTLGVVVLMPLSFPDWKSASFFSTSLVQGEAGFDFLSLFIPANPFRSLSEAIIPSVVVFSLALGTALIGMQNTAGLLGALELLKGALSRITTFVVRLAPIGVFAISANAAGTLPLDQAASLQVYMAVYTLAALALAQWVLPGLVAAVTPYAWIDVIRNLRGVLITAFATGNLFVVLSVLVERSKAMVQAGSDDPEHAGSLVDVVVPVAFTFPSAGKLLSLSFVLFAGWVSGFALSAAQYPTLLAAGIPSYFGATVVAIPFLLDTFQIPSDTFQLFLIADNLVGNRFGSMLGAMHLVSLSLLATAAMAGTLELRIVPLVRYAVISILLITTILVGVHAGFSSFARSYVGYDRFLAMKPLFDPMQAKLLEQPPPPASASELEQPTLDRILGRGALRVGYMSDRLPWVFRNAEGRLVGFDVEMAYELARELGVSLEFLNVARDDLVRSLDSGVIDVGMSGITFTTRRLAELSFSQPYIDETIAFVVRDHRRDDFATRASVQKLASPKIAVPNSPYYIEKLQRYVPSAEITVVETPRDFFRAAPGSFDALLYTAESGSAWSLIYPEFTVAVPAPDILKVPLAYAVRRGDAPMVEFLSAWIELKQRDRTIDRLFDHWILGRAAESTEPRWSILRNVLGRVE